MAAIAHRKHMIFLFMVILATGLAITVGVARWQERLNKRDAQQIVAQRGMDIRQAVLNRMNLYLYGVRSVRGVVLAADAEQMTQAHFLDYIRTRDLAREFPGARGFGLIRRVLPQNRERFVRDMRDRVWPDFTIRQLNPHSGELFPIEFIEPLARNREAIGLDVASESIRREALVESMKQGVERLTGPITLVQATGATLQGFLIVSPIYQHLREMDEQTEPHVRYEDGLGWSYAPLVIDEVMADLEVNPEYFRLQLDDIDFKGRRVNFLDTAPGSEQHQLFTQFITAYVLGRGWFFEFSATPAFVESLNQPQPHMIIVVGSLSSVLVSFLVVLVTANRRSRQQMKAEKAHIATIIEHSTDAIIGQALDGTITGWNKAAAEMFGFTEEEALGRSVEALLLPPDRLEEDRALLEGIMAGRTVRLVDTERQHKSGRRIPVSVVAGGLQDDLGNVIGAAKLVHDISHHKVAQQQLKAFNAQLEQQVRQRTEELDLARNTLRTVLDAMPSMIGYWDRDLVNRVANTAYEQWYGLSLPGRRLCEVMDESLFEDTRAYIEAALQGETQVFERVLVPPDGSRMIHTLAHYLPDVVDGEVKGFYAMIHDVTDLVESRQQLADAVRENAALLNTINEQMLYSATDLKGRIIEVNDKFCELTGYSRETLLGKTHRLVNSGHHSQQFWQAVWQQILAGKAWHGEICNRSRQGQLMWYDTVIAPFMDSAGNIERFVALRTDITDRKEAEAERHRVSLLLNNVLRAATEIAIIATDAEGDVVLFNAGAEQMLGYQAETVMGTSVVQFFAPDDVAQKRAQVSANEALSDFAILTLKAQAEVAERLDTFWQREDQQWLEISLVVTAIRDEAGALEGYLWVAQDVRQQKESERHLMAAKQAAEHAAQAKGQFLANMSHEIRTPMNAVLGMLQLVQQTTLSPRQSDYVNKAFAAATSLLGLLNDILDFSKIDAGKLALDPHPFSLEKLMRDLAIVLSGNLGSKPVELMFDLSPQLPQMVIGDALRLQQILINLSGNAIKFTEQGQIVVAIKVLNRVGPQLHLRFSIQDSGIGISAEQQAHIFDSFSQAEASTTRRYGGTGLGLAICRRLVYMMGGELCVNSTLGEGSCFSFDIVLPVDVEVPEISEDQPRRVLVVDDNALTRDILVDIGRALDWQVDSVDDGQQVLAAVQQAQHKGMPYEMILMDWRMPGMDGLTAALQVRQKMMAQSPKIIMLSAYGHQALLAQDITDPPPFEAFLTKPLTPAQLLGVVQSVLKHGNEPYGMPALPAHRALASMQILVVEDNGLNRQVAQELLAGEGAEVKVAEHGRQGVSMVMAQAPAFDVVLMDMQMPVMDGLEATRLIRRDARFDQLPIVAMTANASEVDRKACLDAGMNEHLGKPVILAQLIDVLCRVTGRSGKVSPYKMPDLQMETPFTQALLRFGGNIELYARSLSRFESEGTTLLEVLKLALQVGHQADAQRSLHSLKGLSLTLGAQKLADMSAAWEARLKASEGALDVSPDEIFTPLYEQLAVDYQQLYQQLLDAGWEAEAPRSDASDEPSEHSEPLHQVLGQLLPQLESQNMAALNQLPVLQAVQPASAEIVQLIECMEALDFMAAAELVRMMLKK
ncbi:hypothetical protein BFW38_14905 [Terasakiispira papahanaumokuakeensis]|uniref:Sensory/regulatory protein RpfC n=1 Tax=Terasakiispira papahanaumokuakeensis TaxID=197479 RepID=A0A1E2VCP2_9GAMM|nr:PAS domain S-box protein [Terasakiispira papahanaumokuakeensis]ODC04622.1 hypothetical protein BFW38_14905 [Terasakiispira papahanaumokuakeensis]